MQMELINDRIGFALHSVRMRSLRYMTKQTVGLQQKKKSSQKKKISTNMLINYISFDNLPFTTVKRVREHHRIQISLLKKKMIITA